MPNPVILFVDMDAEYRALYAEWVKQANPDCTVVELGDVETAAQYLESTTKVADVVCLIMDPILLGDGRYKDRVEIGDLTGQAGALLLGDFGGQLKTARVPVILLSNARQVTHLAEPLRDLPLLTKANTPPATLGEYVAKLFRAK